MIFEAEFLKESVQGKTIVDVKTVCENDSEGFTLYFSDGTYITLWGGGTDSSAHWIDFQTEVEE
jgi:hypothetical protein